MKFLYYLAALGNPDFEVKVDILKNNLNYIFKDINTNFDILINCYDDIDITSVINKIDYPFLDNIYINYKTGKLIELWNNNPYHIHLPNYDYILFILDDVEIESLNVNELIKIKKQYNIEFISPRVEYPTWEYMNLYSGNKLAITNRVEIYCFLFNYENFMKFLSINDIENPNTWGVDYIMAHYKIKTSIYYKFTVVHKLQNKSNTVKNYHKAIFDMDKFFKKNGYDSREDFLNKFPDDIIEVIELSNEN
jgi:hypothetical protein